jgi:hypothetical protein
MRHRAASHPQSQATAGPVLSRFQPRTHPTTATRRLKHGNYRLHVRLLQPASRATAAPRRSAGTARQPVSHTACERAAGCDPAAASTPAAAVLPQPQDAQFVPTPAAVWPTVVAHSGEIDPSKKPDVRNMHRSRPPKQESAIRELPQVTSTRAISLTGSWPVAPSF